MTITDKIHHYRARLTALAATVLAAVAFVADFFGADVPGVCADPEAHIEAKE